MVFLDIKKIYGQQYIIDSLLSLIEADELPKLLVFSGISGTGKTTTARCLAALFCCDNKKDNSVCEQCVSCKQIISGDSKLCIELDVARYQIDDVDELIEDLKYLPINNQSPKKFYILDECHNMSPKSWSALLKVFEASDSVNHFILITNYVDQLPDNILNRSVRYHFDEISQDIILSHVQNLITSSELAQAINWASEGSMRIANNLIRIAKTLSKDNIQTFIERNCGYVLSDQLQVGSLITLYKNGGSKLYEFINQYTSKTQNYVPFIKMSQKVLYEILITDEQQNKLYGDLLWYYTQLLEQKYINKYCILSVIVRAYGSHIASLKDKILYYLLQTNHKYLNHFITHYNKIDIAEYEQQEDNMYETIKNIINKINFEQYKN